MSAILKALRKIQQESGREGEPGSFPRKLDTKRVISQRAKKGQLFRRLAGFAAIALVLSGGLVLAVSYKPFFISPLPSAPVPASQEREEARQDPLKAGIGPLGLAERPAPETTRSSARIPAEKARAGEEMKGFPSERVPQAAGLSREIYPRAESAPLLELQAIVWSDDPESCFAVINGRIVRTGGTVDGVAVSEIGKDSVSLRLGGRTWTMRMLEGD